MKRGEGPTKEWERWCITCGSPRKSEGEEEGEEEAAGPKRSEKSKSWEGSSAAEVDGGMWRWVSLEASIEWKAFFW